MCACEHVRVHVRMCASACACVHLHVHVCMCACVHVCMCACVHVCMCACAHVHEGVRALSVSAMENGLSWCSWAAGACVHVHAHTQCARCQCLLKTIA